MRHTMVAAHHAVLSEVLHVRHALSVESQHVGDLRVTFHVLKHSVVEVLVVVQEYSLAEDLVSRIDDVVKVQALLPLLP